MNALKIFAILIFVCISYLGFSQNTILWKVTLPDSGKVTYILGTYHQMGNSFVDSFPIISEKLKQAELGIFESVDDPNRLVNIINSRRSSLDIDKTFNKSELKFLRELSAGWTVDLYKLNPAELLMKLQQEYYLQNCGTVKPNDEWSHFDNYLISIAKHDSIKIIGLETTSLQIEMINREGNHPNWKNKKKAIRFWIRKYRVPNPEDKNCDFARKYMSLNLDYEFTEDCAEDVLIKERNLNWMEVLPDYLNTKSCFMAVGLFHLYRKCGLLEELQKKGFLVEEEVLLNSNK